MNSQPLRVLILLMSPAVLSVAQELTNESVIAMARAGIRDDVIAYAVANQPGTYSLTERDLGAMKKAGVSDRTMASLIVKMVAAAPMAVPSHAADVGPASAMAPSSYPSSGNRNETISPASMRAAVMNAGGDDVRKPPKQRRPGVVSSSASIGGGIGSGVGRIVGGSVGVGLKLGGIAIKTAAPTAIGLATRVALAGVF